MMVTTREWAAAKGVVVSDSLPAVDGYDELVAQTVGDVARRTIILHCVAAVGYGVEQEPIVEWLSAESILEFASPSERRLLTGSDLTVDERRNACWRQEAQWALLWAISKIDSLGLPVATCNTSLLVDSIMPALGDSTDTYLSTARLRSAGEILVEEDRVYNLHCYARKAHRQNTMPSDLIYPVLFQRHYAFEWLTGDAEWDSVSTDT